MYTLGTWQQNCIAAPIAQHVRLFSSRGHIITLVNTLLAPKGNAPNVEN